MKKARELLSAYYPYIDETERLSIQGLLERYGDELHGGIWVEYRGHQFYLKSLLLELMPSGIDEGKLDQIPPADQRRLYEELLA